MREELLAHLTAIYDEEMAKLNDSAAALAETNRRFGDSGKLAHELEISLPWSERISFAVERHFGWRAPESAARYCVRLGINFGICMACCCSLPLLIESLLINKYNTADWWMLVRLCGLFLFWLPASMAVLTWIYFQLRDAMWGAFGCRKSPLRMLAFAGMMAAFAFLFMLVFLTIEEWNLGRQGILGFASGDGSGGGCHFLYHQCATQRAERNLRYDMGEFESRHLRYYPSRDLQRSLGTGNSGIARIKSHRLAKGFGGRFENRFGNVVSVRAVGNGDVQIHFRVLCDAFEKFFDQLGRKSPGHGFAIQRSVENERCPAGKIEGDLGERFIHGNNRPAVAVDASLIAERFFDGLTEDNPYVFDRVVSVDVQVAVGFDVEIDQAVASQKVEHVVKKTYAGVDSGFAGAVEIKG